jgi:hypothetical protein
LSKPLEVVAALATEPMLVSVGLVCSVGDMAMALFSKDGHALYSSDGYVLYGKRL